ncbi:MAG: DUF547 domain-containing protein [Planctomycetota bacterium]
MACPHSLAREAQEQGFDFSDYAAALKTFVNGKAMVNYRGLKAEPGRTAAFVAAMAGLEPDGYEKWTEADKIAFWLNAYNGLTLKVIIDNYPIKSSFFRSRIYPKNSIRQISGVWDKITMAMVCAAMGCPPLRGEPYASAKLDEQLDDQTRRFLADSAKFKIDRREGRLYISPIFKWFAEDFVKSYSLETNIGGHDREESAVLNFIASYLPEADKNYVLGGMHEIKYLKYDWSLNEQQAKK